ncbi:hypothetical protein FB567DRAFT_21456 [Paraphoma chrysanthemicola]|uniref:Zn(2)-C6 fungal-type domain-containing protein n=1 Tax=Paraphoma chrysanthemicola TaxID=798071 RepID=A0A8K0RIL4_9PLEO|nr:hypothetical protein FB567DRAFT_21456 [Paraphoma chrysanthemicola]
MSLPGRTIPHDGARASDTSSVNDPTHPATSRVRRRNRQITSCLECRRRKLKCDKGSPCLNCTKNARQCVFIASGLDSDAQRKLAEVKEKMGMLERSLENDVARVNRSRSGDGSEPLRPSKLPGQERSYSDQEEDEDTRDLPPSHFATEDAAYFDDYANDDDDVVDLGIAMGRVRVTERVGGLVRPRFSEELAQALKELPPSTEREVLNASTVQQPQDWLAPSKDYVAPASGFFFAPGINKTSLMAYLPSKPLVDRLIAHYWEAVHLIARVVHRQTFETHYERFWADINIGQQPRASFQALLFAALLSSAVAMHEHKVFTDYGVDKQSLVDNFRQGTESALARAHFLRATKLETLQAFVMYLIPLCRNEVSRAHSALTGTAIRLAECMGLHRDPTTYSTSPVDIQVRRLVWYQICFLDLRTSEATGPRPQIRHDDYDTKFPLNIDDSELDRAQRGDTGINTTKDRPHFTGMTITRMRFECYEMHRFLWFERPKVEQRRADGERKVTLISLLSRVQSFKAAMEKTYLPMLNKREPLHVLASEIYGIISDRLIIMLLQRYISSDRSKMPARLRQVVMSSATTTIEHSMAIEQTPALSTWSWYIGALHQYHAALLLLNELNTSRNPPEVEARVWKCLDFSFGLPSSWSTTEKTRFLLQDLSTKAEIYANMKRLRAPTNMPHAGPRKHTPGFQARQNDERQRSASFQSSSSNSALPEPATGSSPPVQQGSPAPQASDYHKQAQQTQTISFPGAVPNTDWGTIDLSSVPHLQQNFDSPGLYGFNDYMQTVHTANPPPAAHQRPGGDGNNSGAAIHAGGTSARTNSSPMDAMNDIDWNDIEQVFSGSEMGSGMIIPPYTFPQFSPQDLQWPGASI